AKVRSLFQVFKALVSFCMFAKTRSVHGKLNPLWENLHYPGRPEEKKRPPRILVLEKAVYFHPADASFNELQGFWDHYESAALLTSEDLSMMLLAGSAWGGGVSAEAVLHNVPNQVLLDGAIKLGYPVEAVPQNTNGHVHECGFCTLGCPYGEKQGSHVTWLRDAADAGAKFIDGCYVDKVMYVKDAASGVEATVLNGSVRLVVKAKTVVCCAGSLHTPALLLRSGLRNPNIGRHLRLHPVATVHGFFPHKQVQSWSGSILTTVCNVVRNIHGHGYVSS
ncbi:hypothetical protein DYB28_013226, partial [Aphanomyces astaci]